MGFHMVSETQALLDAMSAELGNIGAVRDEQGTGEEPAFAVPVVESWCADVGRKLLGKESSDIDRDAGESWKSYGPTQSGLTWLRGAAPGSLLPMMRHGGMNMKTLSENLPRCGGLRPGTR